MAWLARLSNNSAHMTHTPMHFAITPICCAAVRATRTFSAQAARGIDEAGFAQGLQKAGYATDPGYADKLSRTIKTTPQS